jgi:predicted Zn-dependent protease
MCRATMLVETQGKARASVMETVDSTGILTQTAFAGHDMAIGLEYARRQDIAAARRMLDSIRSRSAAMKQARSSDGAAVGRYTSVAQNDVDTVGVIEQILEAAIEFASGNRENGIQKAIAAGEAEDRLIFEYGPPAIVKPAWEMAGEILLTAGKKSEAADAFRRVLKRYPNRRLSNEGLKNALAAL